MDKQQGLTVIAHDSTFCDIQHSVITHNGREYEKEYIYVELSHFTVQKKLTTLYINYIPDRKSVV